MDSDSYNLFISQLGSAIEAFPNLCIVEKDGHKYLKGILDIYDDKRIYAGSFLVEIKHKEGFPYLFPHLFEIGGEIPNFADWHKYSNGSCCITVSADEILKCINGITVREFISIYAIGYLANHIHRVKEGYYKNGEYAHGKDGIIQFYTDLLKTDNISRWSLLYECAFENYTFKKYDLCFCGSGKSYRKCHEPSLEALRRIGKKQVLFDFGKLILK